MKALNELTEREILALAISNEEEDGRIFADFAHSLRDDYPDTAQMFVEMAIEEDGHRRQLIDLFVGRFGDHIPLVRRQDVRGNIARKPVWQVRSLGVDAVRRQAALMERDAERFYRQAAGRSTDAGIRKLLGDLAEAEAGHERKAGEAEANHLPAPPRPPPPRARPPRGETPAGRGAWQGGQGCQPALHPPGDPAGPRRPDGRLGLDAGAGLRGRLRDP